MKDEWNKSTFLGTFLAQKFSSSFFFFFTNISYASFLANVSEENRVGEED